MNHPCWSLLYDDSNDTNAFGSSIDFENVEQIWMLCHHFFPIGSTFREKKKKKNVGKFKASAATVEFLIALFLFVCIAIHILCSQSSLCTHCVAVLMFWVPKVIIYSGADNLYANDRYIIGICWNCITTQNHRLIHRTQQIALWDSFFSFDTTNFGCYIHRTFTSFGNLFITIPLKTTVY